MASFVDMPEVVPSTPFTSNTSRMRSRVGLLPYGIYGAIKVANSYGASRSIVEPLVVPQEDHSTSAVTGMELGEHMDGVGSQGVEQLGTGVGVVQRQLSLPELKNISTAFKAVSSEDAHDARSRREELQHQIAKLHVPPNLNADQIALRLAKEMILIVHWYGPWYSGTAGAGAATRGWGIVAVEGGKSYR
eukprot:gene634-2070_t